MVRKTHEEFIKEVYDGKKQLSKKDIFQEKLNRAHGDSEYTVLGEYVNNSTPILIQHNVCKHKWETRPNNMVKTTRPTRCPVCYGTHLWTKQEFEEKLKERTNNGDNYKVTGQYVNNSTNIELECNNCKQKIDWYSPRTLLSNDINCPFCSDSIPGALNKKIIKHRMKLQDLDKEYDYLNHYIKGKSGGTYIKLKHNCKKCNNHEFEVYHYNFLVKNTTCPKCNEMNSVSKMENLTKYYLDNNGIRYNKYHKFKDCFNIRYLPFDFFLINNDYLIETDGKQHFNGYNDSEESKIEQQKRDRIKDKYCLDNNLTLLRIAYTQVKNIDVILNDLLNLDDLSKYDDILLISEGEILVSNGLYSDLARELLNKKKETE